MDIIKGIMARIIIRDEVDYCAYCILDTLNKNTNGLSYKTLYNTIGKYFTPKIFDSAWFDLKFSHYIIRIDNTNRYIYGAQAYTNYKYNILL